MSSNARLDVESADERQARLARLLASQDEPAFPAPRTGGPPTTFPVGPPSDLLSRLQAFLPQMAAANAELASRPLGDVDIENVGEDQEQYVEMDLGLGVFNARMQGDEEDDESSSSEETSSSDGDGSDDSSDEDQDDGVPAALKINAQAGAKKAKTGSTLIEVLEDKDKPAQE